MTTIKTGTVELKRVCIQLIRTAVELVNWCDPASADILHFAKEVREQLGAWNGEYPTPQRLLHLSAMSRGLLATLPEGYSVDRHILEALQNTLYEVCAGWCPIAAGEAVHRMHEQLFLAIALTPWSLSHKQMFRARRNTMRCQVYEVLRARGEELGHPTQHVMGMGPAVVQGRRRQPTLPYIPAVKELRISAVA